MRSREFHIGPGATSLILVAVVLCMGVLGILGLANSRNDARMAERSIVMAEGVSTLYDRSERALASLDEVVALWQQSAGEEAALRAQLPAGMTLEESVVSWQETNDLGQKLWCAARIGESGQTPRLTWMKHYIETEAGVDNGVGELIWN